MKLSYLYLKAEYKKRLFATLKQLAMLTLFTSFIFFFASMWPAFNFYNTAAYQNANFKFRLNGPINKKALKLINQASGNQAVGLKVGSFDLVSSGSKTINGGDLIYYFPNQYDQIKDTFFSDRLLIKGKVNSHDIAIDYMTAKQLGVGLGDVVSFSLTIPFKENTRRVTQSQRISAIYATTNETKGLLAPIRADVASLILNDGVIFTDVFTKKLRPNILKSNFLEQEEIDLETLPILYTSAKSRQDQTFNRNTRYAVIWIAIVLYLVYVLRDQFVRLDKRKKNIAIFTSLGFSKRNIQGLLIGEQIGLNVLTITVGFMVSIWMIESKLGLFIPKETIYFFVLNFIGINLIVMASSYIQISYLLKKFDVAKLLVME